MATASSQPSRPTKHPFNDNIWIADENGNVYYIVRNPSDPNRLEGIRVSTRNERWDFLSRDELAKHFPRDFPQDPKKPDASVAIVKMLLTLGVAAAAIPKGILDDTDVSNKGTSYVINLASFDKANVFWPDDSIKQMIEIKPHGKP